MDGAGGHAARRRWWLLHAAGTGAVAAISVFIFRHSALTSCRRRLLRLSAAAAAFADALSSLFQASAALFSDVASFVDSDSDHVPLSVRQLYKLASSAESADAVTRLTESVTAAAFRGYYASAARQVPSPSAKSGFLDRLFDKLVSPSGAVVASDVASSAARSLVVAYLDNFSRKPELKSDSPSGMAQWVAVVAGEPFRDAVQDWVRASVSAAVKVFVEKTIHINAYDQLFAGLTNPDHEARVRDMLVSVCSSAVEALVNSSHEVLSKEKKKCCSRGVVMNQPAPMIRKDDCSGSRMKWVETLSTTLAVPRNRSFVLDVTGRVTFETVQSFLGLVFAKMHDSMRRRAETLNLEAVGRGLLVLSYSGAKSLFVAAVCITLCLHVLHGTRAPKLS